MNPEILKEFFGWIRPVYHGEKPPASTGLQTLEKPQLRRFSCFPATGLKE